LCSPTFKHIFILNAFCFLDIEDVELAPIVHLDALHF
jgi:hypothetical protein